MNINLELLKLIHHDMDSTCYASILKQWNQNDYTERELDQLKIKDMYRYCNLLNQEEQMYDRMESNKSFFELAERLIEYGTEDTYFSLNSFYKKNKSTEDVRHINAFVMDFDYYKISKYQNLSAIDFYTTYLSKKMPFQPTAVIDSGRGLYVIFVIKHCSYHMTKLYKRITEWMFDKFKRYGLDDKALNITQVIRLPGTINSKSLSEVKILEFNKTAVYRIQKFAKLLPYTQEEVKAYKRNKVLKLNQVKVNEQKKANYDQRKKYFNQFFNDIKKLLSLRSYNMEGYREYILFIVRERAVWSGYTIDQSIKKASVINGLFKEPLSTYDIEKTCRPSKRKNKSSLKKIMNKLNMTLDEMIHMKQLKIKNLKDKSKSKNRRRHSLLNRTDKEIEMLERRQDVLYLKYEKKLSNTEIAKIKKVDKSTITNDLKYIRSHPAEFKIQLEDHLKELDEYVTTDDFKMREMYKRQLSIINVLEIGDKVLSEFGIQMALQGS